MNGKAVWNIDPHLKLQATLGAELNWFTFDDYKAPTSLSPFGRWKYYNVTIRANASILQDLKYEQRSQTQSNIQWY